MAVTLIYASMYSTLIDEPLNNLKQISSCLLFPACEHIWVTYIGVRHQEPTGQILYWNYEQTLVAKRCSMEMHYSVYGPDRETTN